MAPDKDGNRKPARDEFEVACDISEPGRPLQRKLLQRHFEETAESGVSAAAHGDETLREADAPLPRKDRAG